MDRVLGSARVVGLVLLLVPVALGVGLNLFPNYDARSDQFASSYSHIVDAGAAFPLSLVLFALTFLLLGFLVMALRRAPQAADSGGMAVVSAGLGGSAGGILLAALLSIPVWVWARQVKNGTLTFGEGAERSQGLASTSQTLILLLGLGGLVVGLTVLGILSWRYGWTSPFIFWVTIAAATVTLIGGLSLTLFWVSLGLPPILWTLMIGGSLAIKGAYTTRP